MVCPLPAPGPFDTEMLLAFDHVKEAISGIRKIRTERNIPQKDQLELMVQPGDKGYETGLVTILKKMANLSSLTVVDTEVQGAASFRVKSTGYYILLEGIANPEEELKKLEDELFYTKGFLESVMKKLGNDRFVNSAPAAVVEKEKIKQADALAKIKVLEEQIAALR